MTIQQDVQLSNILWYKIGGKVKYLLEAKSKEDILEALKFIQENQIEKFVICSLGTNLIFQDDYYDGAVLRIIHGDHEQISFKEESDIEAYSGEILDHVLTKALDNNLLGMEWAGGLPGSVGGAVRGNVGAFGHEIKNNILEIEVAEIGEDGNIKTYKLTNEQLNFSYRQSLIKEKKGKLIILSATFRLQKVTPEQTEIAKKTYKNNIQFRKEHHPLEYPNCGSVFKNIHEAEKIEKVLEVFPELKEKMETQWHGKIAVGSLIQKLGLQGYRVGDAQVSTKHALFIVNLGHAKASDVLTVIDKIQSTFLSTFGFSPEPEVEIVN